MSQQSPNVRPFTVTLMVVLVWVNAILTFVAGLALVLGANNATILEQFNGEADAAKISGWTLLVLGVIIALIAMGLSRGSRFLRMLLTILLVLRIASDVYLMFASNYDAAALISMAFSFFLLWLMWNSRANEFFSRA